MEFKALALTLQTKGRGRELERLAVQIAPIALRLHKHLLTNERFPEENDIYKTVRDLDHLTAYGQCPLWLPFLRPPTPTVPVTVPSASPAPDTRHSHPQWRGRLCWKPHRPLWPGR